MALIPCPECEHKVSTSATACPACGYPLSSPEQNIEPDGVPSPSAGKATRRDDPVSLAKQELEQLKNHFATVRVEGMTDALEEAKDLLVGIRGQDDYDAMLALAKDIEYFRNVLTEASRAGKDVRSSKITEQESIATLRRMVSGIKYPA